MDFFYLKPNIVCRINLSKLIRDGLYELRTEYGGNIYRVFFIFDDGKIVVLFNEFSKENSKDTNKRNR